MIKVYEKPFLITKMKNIIQSNTSMKNFIVYENNLYIILNMTVVTKNIQVDSKSKRSKNYSYS